MTSKTISILGSTGSIGCSTLDVIRESNRKYQKDASGTYFEVVALTANVAANELIKQAIEFRPKFVVMVDNDAGNLVKSALEPLGMKVGIGVSALNDAAQMPAQMVMAAIVGAAGLRPTLEAVKRGATILLANKECLVSAGSLFLKIAAESGSKILPVDSEHNAIFQVLGERDGVEKLILTASGGPFLHTKIDDLRSVTPKEAIAHPNWQMGQKISVDCASMMNKGLELIEASFLFDFDESMIDVLVHPQSIIHSMVSYKDGSFLAQLGSPDMRIPISFCMGWPNRLAVSTPRLDLAQIGRLEFYPPDDVRFPALSLARQVLRTGGSAPTILNAANEIAVDAFLKFNLPFISIPSIVTDVLEQAQQNSNIIELDDLDAVFDADEWGRAKAKETLTKLNENRFVNG